MPRVPIQTATIKVAGAVLGVAAILSILDGVGFLNAARVFSPQNVLFLAAVATITIAAILTFGLLSHQEWSARLKVQTEAVHQLQGRAIAWETLHAQQRYHTGGIQDNLVEIEQQGTELSHRLARLRQSAKSDGLPATDHAPGKELRDRHRRFEASLQQLSHRHEAALHRLDQVELLVADDSHTIAALRSWLGAGFTTGDPRAGPAETLEHRLGEIEKQLQSLAVDVAEQRVRLAPESSPVGVQTVVQALQLEKPAREPLIQQDLSPMP